MHSETPQLTISRVFDGPSNQGWLEAFEKLDATLLHLQAARADIEV